MGLIDVTVDTTHVADAMWTDPFEVAALIDGLAARCEDEGARRQFAVEIAGDLGRDGAALLREILAALDAGGAP